MTMTMELDTELHRVNELVTEFAAQTAVDLHIVLMRDDELDVLNALVDTLPDDALVVEYGCGGSTVHLAGRLKPTQRLISIEHNRAWYDKVAPALASYPNVTLRLYAPEMDLAFYAYSNPQEELPVGLTDYLNPEVPWDEVSLVIVDGIARGTVLALCAARLPPWTPVLLHDYTGRENWYDWALTHYDRHAVTSTLLELTTRD